MRKTLFLLCFSLAFANPAFGQQDIADARKLNPGTEVSIRGIVTNGPELGMIRYVQDHTGGIVVYSSRMSGTRRGDSVSVSGTLKDYYTLLEIDPVESLTIHSSDRELPLPLVLTPSQFDESHEGMLVRVDSVEFFSSGPFERTSYSFSAGSESGQVYISDYDSPLIGTPIPEGKISLVGVLGAYKGTYQVLPRDADDLITSSSIHLTSTPVLHNLSSSGFVVDWTTDVPGSTEAFYGFTPEMERGVLQTSGSTTMHSIEVSGLSPAQLVYMQPYSVHEADTAKATLQVYISRSASGGEIRAFFNRSVDHSVSLGLMEAEYLKDGIDNQLIAYIDQAEESIDMAIYNINNEGIFDITRALNQAHARGVTVRVVHNGNTACLGLNSLNPAIGRIASPKQSYPDYGIMHNKFVIFDAHAADPDQALVWTGSTNLTEGQIYTVPNNGILIEDQSLAKAYWLEFNEMFGSEDTLPDPTRARFGPDKTDNTPHYFLIGNVPVVCYFSPSDGAHAKILQAIESADQSIQVATMLITKQDLGNALAREKDEGADVKVLLNDYDQYGEAIVNTLKASLGEDVRLKGEPGIMHHKYMIVDQENAGSDPLLLTGSHNWSSSASLRNDENTLIFHGQGVANAYYQEFVNRFAAGALLLTSGDKAAASLSDYGIRIYPNPADRWIRISVADHSLLQEISLRDLSGRVLRKFAPHSNGPIQVANLRSGLYLLQIRLREGSTLTHKIQIH
jgi:phosphatidylserine/phosphatidylglycerophosphate/cardiolipin synthase-like enzyme